MAKAIYLGVDGKARKMKKAYIGIDGKAHKIKKVYVGVDGKAKLVYTDYVPVTGISLSWSISSPYYSAATVGNGNFMPGSATIYAAVSPADATSKKLTWSLSGSSCRITGYNDTQCWVRASESREGSSYLTATSADGVVARAIIYVERQDVSYSDGKHTAMGYANAITSISRW